jgi:superfamily II DNA or RNA helicase
MRSEALLLDFAGTGPAPDADEWYTGLRVYQREDAEAAWQALQEHRSTALVMFTGAGKTRTGGSVIKRMLETPGARCLWLANRDFLVKEAARRLREMCGVDVSIEKADRQMSRTPIVVGSIQTLVRKDRRETIPRDTFDLIVYDECHHAASAGSMAILEWFTAARLGLTATLTRHDKVGAWNAWASIAAERTIEWGMTEGYFCPIVPVARYIDSIDLSKVKTTAGDLNLGGLEKEIAEAAAPIAHLAHEEMGDRPCIVYTPGVASAHAVAATLNQFTPGSARAVDADTPEDERDQILAAFDRGELQWIVNCGIYLEGLDVPKCRGIVIARPTKSEPLYIQMAGRGGRPEGWIGQLASRDERVAAIAGSGKPNFILLDITGHAGRHSLCSAATLAGKETPAKELADVLKANPGIDLQSAAKQAKAAVAREQKRIAEMAKAAEVSARRSTFELFSKYNIAPEVPGLEPAQPSEPPSAADVDFLLNNKLCQGRKGDGDVPTGITHADVLKLQRTAAVWRKHALATFKQRRALNNCGIATPFHLPFQKASQLLEHCAATGWRPNMQFVAQVMGPREVGAEG